MSLGKCSEITFSVKYAVFRARRLSCCASFLVMSGARSSHLSFILKQISCHVKNMSSLKSPLLCLAPKLLQSLPPSLECM